MDKFNLSTILLGSFLLFSSSPRPQVYQVMTSHPHDVQEFKSFIQTVKQTGRLWLVHVDPKMPKHLMEHFRATDGQDVRHYLPAKTKSLHAISQIKDFTNRIEISNIKADVESLANFKTRAVGTADNQKATTMVKDFLQGLGYSTSVQCYRPEACSVIVDKAGESSSKKVIMIMAHLDSVGRSFAGADDNASGTAVLMEVARVLKDYDNKNTIRFFVTNGEESGLLGAKHYANVLKNNGEIKNLILAINMDMVGYNSNGIVELETDEQYEKLANWFAQLAGTYTKLKSKITIGAWGSDHVPFINGGVPTLLTIEDWSTKTPCYHTECDKPNTLNYDYAGEIAKLNLAAMMAKDIE